MESCCEECPALYTAALNASSDRLELKEALWERPHVESCPIPSCVGPKLAQYYLRTGRYKKTDVILEKLHYVCRLSNAVFAAARPSLQEPNLPLAVSVESHSNNDPYWIADDFLSQDEIEILQKVFLNIENPYWTDHNYSGGIQNPSPYFSFVLPLNNDSNNDPPKGVLEQLIQRLQTALNDHFPVHTANYVELWAHNRPGDTGHQFHFDSDNEGHTTVVRHPICSCVVYLCGGGPTVLLPQRLASQHLASRAWIIPPAIGRIASFDGSLLHGVLPSHSVEERRVSVMLAFWRTIRVRDTQGAAQAFPRDAKWAQPLVQSVEQKNQPLPVWERRRPVLVKPAYQSVPNGEPWKRSKGLPEYEQIYQGV